MSIRAVGRRAIGRSAVFMFMLVVLSILSVRCMGPTLTVGGLVSIAPVESTAGAASPAPEAEPAAIRGDLFDEAIAPVVSLAARARAERQRADPAYVTRIDVGLNEHRVNFLLFGYGETYEPPLPRDVIGSITILSLDYRAHSISQSSLTHDARTAATALTSRGRFLRGWRFPTANTKGAVRARGASRRTDSGGSRGCQRSATASGVTKIRSGSSP